MNVPCSTRRVRMALVIVFLSALSQASQAAEFFAIVDNYGKRPLNAYVDVSVDTVIGPQDVLFQVFSTAGGPLAEFTVRTNHQGLASTSSVVNLFDLTAGQPMLVRARTNASATPSAAMLHTDSRGAPLTLALWPTNKRDGTALAAGKEFHIALGSFRSASLLVANVGGTDQVVDIHVGTRGADGSGIYSNPRLGLAASWRVDLSQNEALSNLVVSSTGPIVVQLMLDHGTKPQSFVVLPIF